MGVTEFWKSGSQMAALYHHRKDGSIYSTEEQCHLGALTYSPLIVMVSRPLGFEGQGLWVAHRSFLD